MIDDNEQAWAAVRRRLDAVTRDIVIPASPGFAGPVPVSAGTRPAVISRDAGLLRRLTAVGLAVLLVAVVGNGLQPTGGETGGSGSLAHTSSAPSATTDDSHSAAAATSTSASTVTSVDLPTHSMPTENGACPAAKLGRVILRADRSLAQPVYVEKETRKLSLLWPYGFTARFVPQLEILDDRGDLVAREGDMLDVGGGVTDPRFDFFACKVFRVDP